MENNENENENGKKRNGKSVMICAYLALAISVILAFLWICNVNGLTVVTLETFVGVIVALLAIIVTIAIIWQIFNVVEIRNRIQDLNKLEDKINNQEKSLEQFKFEISKDLYSIMMVIKRDKNELLIAFLFSLAALDSEIQLDEPDQYDIFLDFMETLNEFVGDSVEADKNLMDSIRERNSGLRSRSNYRLIKRRYEPLYDKLMSKVKKAEK